MMEVSRDGIPIGFAWLSRMSDTAVELHVCAEPDQHGRLLNKQVLSTLMGMMDDSGADHVVAAHSSPVLRRILRRLGFTNHGTHVSILNRGPSDGIPK